MIDPIIITKTSAEIESAFDAFSIETIINLIPYTPDSKLQKTKENHKCRGRERSRILQKISQKFWKKYKNLPFIYGLLFWPHQKFI